MGRWLGIGPRRIELACCRSTNDEAAALGRQGAVHGTVVLSQEQTAGRGRLARRWHSPARENLYLSCLLRPPLPPSAVPPITLAAGIAVCDAVRSRGVVAVLKWPNDVLVGRRKISGILTEMNTRANAVEHAIVGVGVNLNSTDFPSDLADIATSIRIERGGRRVRRAPFVDRLLEELEQRFDQFFAGGVEVVAEAWTQRAALGQVRVRSEDGLLEGRAVGLDRDGALLVEDSGGQRHRVVAGDVVLHPC